MSLFRRGPLVTKVLVVRRIVVVVVAIGVCLMMRPNSQPAALLETQEGERAPPRRMGLREKHSILGLSHNDYDFDSMFLRGCGVVSS